MAATRPILSLVGSLALLCATAAAADAPPGVAAARAELNKQYAASLAELAAWCDEHQLAAEAQRVRGWLPDPQPDQRYLYVLDELRRRPVDTAAETEAGREFQTRFQKLRDAQADALYALAERAAREHQPAEVYELVTLAARENPAHKRAWRMLGYVRVHDQWLTPFEARQQGAGKVWHDEFGWLAKAHVARYESGQRFYRNRWMTADEEARLRSDVSDGWRIETDHYAVTTNHSLTDGVLLARRLERLYAVWQQIFAGYLYSDADLARRLVKGDPPRGRDPQRFNVVCYRDREQYNEALRPVQPQIGITLGIYFDTSKTAYFFAGADQEPGTIYHEATHQLFGESRPVIKDVGQKHNFWIVEAIACYMESLVEHEGYATLGGLDAGRFPAARQRLLQDNFYVPLAELTGWGVADLQHHADISKIYSQSAGLAAFLMQCYPDVTVAYLAAVYAGHADPATLAQLSGVTYRELDAQYRAFVERAAQGQP